MEEQKTEVDPYQWYKERFNTEPSYSQLLEKLGKTQTERNIILRKYFERTAEEVAEGSQDKLPTKAHKAIASLVKDGYIKVIVTTNFDRLFESSLNDVGIVPQVITGADGIKGMMPLVHSTCTILKLNGDYLDTRFKNTISELEEYEPQMLNLLGNILSDFGLIITWWSGDWDNGLRDQLLQASSKRFSNYWTTLSELSEKAHVVSQHLDADVVKVVSADEFFEDVSEKVLSISEYNRAHPVSKTIAITTLKRLLPKEENAIKIHDLVQSELKGVLDKLRDPALASIPGNFDSQLMAKRLKHYDAVLDTFVAMTVNGLYWDQKWSNDLWFRALSSILNASKSGGGLVIYIRSKLYPAYLLHVAGGMALVAREDYKNLYRWLLEVKHKDYEKEQPLVSVLYEGHVLDSATANQVLNVNLKTPLTNYVHSLLKPVFLEIVIDEDSYDSLFMKLEVLKALTFLFVQNSHLVELDKLKDNMVWAPPGMYSWKDVPFASYVDHLHKEFETSQKNWGPIKAGFF